MAEFAVVNAFSGMNRPRTLSGRPAGMTAADTKSPRDREEKTGDVGLDEINWSSLINRYTTEYAEHDADAMKHVDGLTVEQIEEQRKSAESQLAWTKAANAKKLFQMVCRPELPHRRCCAGANMSRSKSVCAFSCRPLVNKLCRTSRTPLRVVPR